MSDAEADIEEFVAAVDAVTPKIVPELLADWQALVEKLRTNLRALVFLSAIDGETVEYLDDIVEVIRDRRAGLDVKLFSIMGKLDRFARARLEVTSPHVAVLRAERRLGEVDRRLS